MDSKPLYGCGVCRKLQKMSDIREYTRRVQRSFSLIVAFSIKIDTKIMLTLFRKQLFCID